MENLKAILFEKTVKKAVKVQRSELGTPTHEAAFNSFMALFSVIEDADLEDEYYEWKRKNGYMD